VTVFDIYATEYEQALAKNLRFIPGGTDHYYKNRVAILARCWGSKSQPEKILDFGAGVGLAIPFLHETFPNAEISITDESRESLRVAQKRHSFVHTIEPDGLPKEYFDVAFVAGVLHHVVPSLRHAVVDQIVNTVRPGGLIVFFELNPINPVTQRLVQMCPFDNDAVLMKKSEVESLISSDSRLILEQSHFTVFFPPLFKPLHRFEKYLAWCPLGAQYYVAVRKK
jgi:SAM-dependent methyltransferase